MQPMTDARLAVLLAAAAVVACGEPTVPANDIRAYDALPIYTTWWDQVKVCADRAGDLARISWFAVKPATDSATAFWAGPPTAPVLVSGEWIAPHRIYVLDTAAALVSFGQADGYISYRPVVAHEMLHDLLGGDPTHSDSAWVRCKL